MKKTAPLMERKEDILTDTDLAEKFVSLVLKRKECWQKIRHLSKQEYYILVGVLSAAKLNFERLVIGQVLESSGQKILNDCCPCRVVTTDEEDSYHATGWLNDLVKNVFVWTTRQGRDKAILNCLLEMKRAVPLEPVILTARGDLLVEVVRRNGNSFLIDHVSEKDEIGCGCHVGLHKHCGGILKRISINPKRDALICSLCKLKVDFVRSVKTYADLRQNLADINGLVEGFACYGKMIRTYRNRQKKCMSN